MPNYISQIDFGDGVVRTIKDPNAGGQYYIEQTVTLSASSDTLVTFNDSNITSESTIDVYTTVSNLGYSDMSISTGVCTITYPKQDTASTVGVRIYIR